MPQNDWSVLEDPVVLVPPWQANASPAGCRAQFKPEVDLGADRRVGAQRLFLSFLVLLDGCGVVLTTPSRGLRRSDPTSPIQVVFLVEGCANGGVQDNIQVSTIHK